MSAGQYLSKNTKSKKMKKWSQLPFKSSKSWNSMAGQDPIQWPTVKLVCSRVKEEDETRSTKGLPYITLPTLWSIVKSKLVLIQDTGEEAKGEIGVVWHQDVEVYSCYVSHTELALWNTKEILWWTWGGRQPSWSEDSNGIHHQVSSQYKWKV